MTRRMLIPLLAGVLVIPVGQAIWPGAGYSMWFVVAASCCAAGALLIPRITTVD